MTAPTPAREPVTLDRRIDAVRRVLDVMVHHSVFDDVINPHHREGLQAALATLQQHKRAMAVVEAARHAGNTGYVTQMMYDALATFDTAEPSE